MRRGIDTYRYGIWVRNKNDTYTLTQFSLKKIGAHKTPTCQDKNIFVHALQFMDAILFCHVINTRLYDKLKAHISFLRFIRQND